MHQWLGLGSLGKTENNSSLCMFSFSFAAGLRGVAATRPWLLMLSSHSKYSSLALPGCTQPQGIICCHIDWGADPLLLAGFLGKNT